MSKVASINPDRALSYLLRFLSVEGTTGNEAKIGREIAEALGEMGVPASAIHFDDAHHRIPLPSESGNLIVNLEGRGEGRRRLFVAHRDTVALCAGSAPRIDGDRVVSATPTALGGDDRAGVACLLNMVAELKEHKVSHPPLTLLFTVREESGAWGARCLRPALLGNPEFAFNLDGPSPSRLFAGAVGAAGWEAEVVGRAAHAGLQPEEGISASMVVAEALAAIHRRGWWGRIRRRSGEGTSNVGRIAGRDGACVGGATNVVTDYAAVEGEARSHDATFIPRIVDASRRAFEYAAARTSNRGGRRAKLEFRSQMLYEPFRLAESSELARFALDRSREVGLSPTLAIANGGLDANWIVSHGVPTMTFGVGQRDVHTVDESVDVPDFLAACRLALALAGS